MLMNYRTSLRMALLRVLVTIVLDLDIAVLNTDDIGSVVVMLAFLVVEQHLVQVLVFVVSFALLSFHATCDSLFDSLLCGHRSILFDSIRLVEVLLHVLRRR